MANLPILQPADASSEVVATYSTCEMKTGFPAPPNFIKALGHSAAVASVTTALVESVLNRGARPRSLKEMMFVAISHARHCRYCEAAHVACCQMLGVDADSIAKVVSSVAVLTPLRSRDIVAFGALRAAGANEVAWQDLPAACASGLDSAASLGKLWIQDAPAGAVTVVAAPLRAEGRLIGARVLLARAGEPYQRQDVRFVEAIAEFLGGAWERIDLANRPDRRRDEFLAFLGHELRNPLAAIAHGLSLLGLVPDDRAQSQSLREMMSRQTQRMGTLLDQLLDIARVVSGRIELARTPVDLADTVRTAVETVRSLIAQQHQRLTVSLPPTQRALVRGDAVRVAQVVENLLANASKYSSPGGQIDVMLELKRQEAEITVRDTGAGIGSDFLPHIFEVFTQPPRTLARAQGGLGLGLPLVKQLVEMHEGRVTASSSGAGQGSEFVVTLPLLPQPDLDVAVADPLRPSPPPAGDFRSFRILVVDDEQDIAGILTELLEFDGHVSIATNDAVSALAVIPTFRPEVVLLDLGMPVMDGYELARRIRRDHGDRNLVLVATTGYSRDEPRLQAAGFDLQLTKPLDTKDLYEVLARFRPPAGGVRPSATPTLN